MKLKINDTEVEVEDGSSVFQACVAAGVEVPHFCYHDKLSVAGNCRMCLVELENAPKPIASCAFPAADGMVVRTNTPAVEAAREGVMEFLLINHPLDCPICDQGGECDLQDQSLGYGRGTSRFADNKRAMPEQYLGPLIKTFMTRCIHCTRCVRFATEIAGVEDLGLINRGEQAEITTMGRALDTEFAGCLVDVCPVGALTSAPYSFAARPWELNHAQSVDVTDAVGSNIRVDSRGRQVLRVLPRLHEEVNEDWIHDKARHAIDGLIRQRLDRPYLRGADGRLSETTWEIALAVLAERMASVAPERMAAIAGNLADCDSLYALKSLFAARGCDNLDCRQEGGSLGSGDLVAPVAWLFNATIVGIEQADAVLLVGCNPRDEGALVNARLRKRFLQGVQGGVLPIGRIGTPADLTYAVEPLGETPEALEHLLAGQGFAEALKGANKPLIMVGAGTAARSDGKALWEGLQRLSEQVGAVGQTPDWNGFSVLHSAASRVGGLMLGFVPTQEGNGGKGGKGTAEIVQAAQTGELDLLWLLGADELGKSAYESLAKTFVVYQGHHGDAGASHADLVLPAAAWPEKEGIYVNTEGRVQRANRAIFPPGEAREDWKIIRALSGALAKESDGGAVLPFDNLAELRQKLFADYPVLAELDKPQKADWSEWQSTKGQGVKGQGTKGQGTKDSLKFSSEAFAPIVPDFYRTDSISRVSETMARCSAVRKAARNGSAEQIFPQMGSPLFDLASQEGLSAQEASQEAAKEVPQEFEAS